MLTLDVCPGVVMTVACAELSRKSFLAASWGALQASGHREPVLVRTERARATGMWAAWWAVGVSSASTLAECRNLVAQSETIGCHKGKLIIYTRRPGGWIGSEGERIGALIRKWGVPIEVKAIEDA